MTFNANDFIGDVISAVRGVVEKDWATNSGKVQTRAEMLAEQFALFPAAVASGGLDEQGIKFAAKRLETQTKEFALTVANLQITTLAKAFNAAIDVVWTAAGGALAGTPLVGLLPAKPQM